MGTTNGLQKALRSWKLKYMLRGQNPDPVRVNAAVDEIIARAKRERKAGVRKDRWLFGFESEFEEISDAITQLRDAGETEAYRDVYRKLYEFAEETMQDSYMPLFLYILYRYAGARRDAGEAKEALELFEELYDGTDRLIGIRNPYGIHCLEEVARAAMLCGWTERAESAIAEMHEIANGEFGPDSAMSLAVTRFEERLLGNEKLAHKLYNA